MSIKKWMRAAAVAAVFSAAAQEAPKTAAGHPIQYYVSLPQGWTADRKWPVVMVIESANRQFQQNLEVFVRARQGMPFILVAPLVVTNGGANYRHVPTYHYPEAVWSEIARAGGCRFDMDGIAAVASDVGKLYGGEEKYFLTAWEAGGHTVWPMILQHPEALRGAALSGTNYAGRCGEGGISTDPARIELPIKAFQAGADPNTTAQGYLIAQTQRAIETAKAHGFGGISEATVPGKPHGPMAEEVLGYFGGLIK